MREGRGEEEGRRMVLNNYAMLGWTIRIATNGSISLLNENF